MKKILTLFFLAATLASAAQVDVQQYRFAVRLSDSSDRIQGMATLQMTLKEGSTGAELDLVQEKGNGKGMKVTRVDGAAVRSFSQVRDKLRIEWNAPAVSGRLYEVTIAYSGIPADGMVISRNQWGERTFFSDHWPNRARHWLPCNDTPADKAAVSFQVTVPQSYKVVSNGVADSACATGRPELRGSSGDRTFCWREETAIPTKVMAIGAARFAVKRVDSAYRVPVTAWVYERDSAKGFYDYAVADDILRFFDGYIGPFPFRKLANVQSKTIFGGMENAGAIFYAENTVTGDRQSESLIAHEIAHQWFGNMATEKSFAHLWLSEGFATYLTNVYWEKAHGREAFIRRMQEERSQVIAFSRRAQTPVVDTASPLMNLLNANSYQKGAWVLHMLRTEVGDTLFQNILQHYYRRYAGGNADTRDFQQVAQSVSGRDLGVFFDQWLYRTGQPKLEAHWRHAGGTLSVTVRQEGNALFRFPLEIGFVGADGRTTIRKVQVEGKEAAFEWPAAEKPAKAVLDPNTVLLFEGSIREGK